MPHTRKKTPSIGVLQGSLGYWLRIAQIRIFKDFEAELAALGVTPAVFSLMEVLAANPGITQSKLASSIHLDRSSMVPMLDKLEKRGIVSRQASTTDRRHNHIYLTDEGHALHQQAREHVSIHDQRTAAPLTAEEKATLIALLKKMTAA